MANLKPNMCDDKFTSVVKYFLYTEVSNEYLRDKLLDEIDECLAADGIRRKTINYNMHELEFNIVKSTVTVTDVVGVFDSESGSEETWSIDDLVNFLRHENYFPAPSNLEK